MLAKINLITAPEIKFAVTAQDLGVTVNVRLLVIIVMLMVQVRNTKDRDDLQLLVIISRPPMKSYVVLAQCPCT